MKLLMSLKNEYWQLIKQSQKRFELRTTIPKQLDQDLEIVFYITAPIKKIMGAIKIKAIHINTPEMIWNLVANEQIKHGWPKENFLQYYQERNVTQMIAYEIDQVEEFQRSMDLTEFGLTSAPQGFIYLEK